MCSLLPCRHAVAGCDTTSRLFVIGKGVSLQKLKNVQHFKKQTNVFSGTILKMQGDYPFRFLGLRQQLPATRVRESVTKSSMEG